MYTRVLVESGADDEYIVSSPGKRARDLTYMNRTALRSKQRHVAVGLVQDDRLPHGVHLEPAIVAAAQVVLGLAALVGRRTGPSGLLCDCIEQDRDRLVVVHCITVRLGPRDRVQAPRGGFCPVDGRPTLNVSAT